MIPKLIVNSALPPVHQIGQDLERCLVSASSFTLSNALLHDLKALTKQSSERWIDIDVASQDQPDDITASLAAWGVAEFSNANEPYASVASQGGIGGFRIHSWNLTSPPIRRSECLFRPVLVVSAATPRVAEEYEIESLLEDRALVVLLNGVTLSSSTEQCWQIQAVETSDPLSSPLLYNVSFRQVCVTGDSKG